MSLLEESPFGGYLFCFAIISFQGCLTMFGRQVALPPSDGVEVIEEDYEYPAKDADASDGWTDARGEFHEY